ncbi:MAG: T9SS type A sorting domain-containing protein [Melioribacteraceae bacterium]|nr:T9SS type A sorting domain-containing protein [Melioribacteraceae bacterium]
MNFMLVILFLAANQLYSQINTVEEALKYYPLHIGNYWEYETIESQPGFGPDISWYIYKKIVADTLLGNQTYSVVESAKLGSESASRIFLRVDSTDGNIYQYHHDKEFVIDSLLAQVDDFLPFCHYLKSFEQEELFDELRWTRFADQYCASSTNYDGWKYTENIGVSYFYETIIIVWAVNYYSYLRYAEVDGVKYGTKTSVKENNDILNKFTLSQNYPNPFNPTTTIKFSVPNVGTSRDLSLRVYDMLGREIQTLLNKPMQPGSYEIEFDGSNLTSGVYFYVLETGGKTLSKKMVLIK